MKPLKPLKPLKPFRVQPLVRRLALREWVSLTLCMVLLGMVLGWQNGLGRGDELIYDQFVSFDGRPARDDIIIVAIDDYSLSQLGRWPWPRKFHAALLDRLTAAGARRVGMDIILSEPERPQADGSRPGDEALAQAIARNKRVVLPVVISDSSTGMAATLPIPEFTDAASGLGHINLQHDDDGVVRSVYLLSGQNGAEWPQFALAMLESNRLFGPSAPITLPTAYQDAANAALANSQHIGRMHIPFAGNNGHYQTVPYVSVLRGEVPPEFFKNKIVLVGAKAVGMTDSYPTPVSGHAGAMAGVEIHANILAALLDHKSIAVAEPWQTALFSALPVLLAMIAYMWLSPRVALITAALLLPMTVLVSFADLHYGLWVAPRAALVAVVLSYPLWSWRRLEAAIAYLGQEFVRLDQEPHLLPEANGEPNRDQEQDQIEDVLERRIRAMRNAARRVRDLRQFVSDSLNNLPDVTLVTRTDGTVLLPNRLARAYFTSIGVQQLEGSSLLDLVAKLQSPELIDQGSSEAFEWKQLLDLRYTGQLANGIGVRDEQSRDLLVKSAPCYSAANTLIGWIITIVDISTIRAAERSRDETLRFLSHDMRAPQASILALLELQSEPESSLPQQEFFTRIEKASRKTLGLADNFVQLARAESHEYRLEEIDFQDMLLDAIDEMWTQANAKQIKLVADIPQGEYPVVIDRGLMTRALVNLISNAINYSPINTRVSCVLRMQASSRQILCHIVDQGYGIAEADKPRLFQRFQRLDHANRPRYEGIGLGLVFVKTVVERHHGNISFFSSELGGTTFTITLPAYLPTTA
jgi:CHASE2 domain-containing sensor protein/signal transduction histidine kinase